jgi:hypothetical protein
LKAQLSTRIAAEEAEQKRRIDAEEEKAVLTVQLEAARGAKSTSAGIADNSDLDTYRVYLISKDPIAKLTLTRELLGAVFVMIGGRIPLLLFVDMYFVRHVLMYHSQSVMVR